MAKQPNNLHTWLKKVYEVYNKGYITLSYITFNNGAYINTLYQAGSGFRWVGAFRYDEVNTTQVAEANRPIVVSRYAPTTTATLLVSWNADYRKPYYNYMGNTILMSDGVGEDITIDASFVSGSGSLTCNSKGLFGPNPSTYSATSGTNTNVCFGLNSIKTSLIGTQLLYDNKGELVRKLIPSRRISDGVCGLLDTVKGVFYANANTSSSSSITGGGGVVTE